MSTEDFPDLQIRTQPLPQDNQSEPSAIEGFRLIVAFRKIRSAGERRKIIELAERFAK